MTALAFIAGLLIIAVILWDSFETIILPRRVTRPIRLTRLFYQSTWRPWSALGRRMRAAKRRENFLSVYGPLSLLMLFVVWAAGLIVAFAILYWALGSPIKVPNGAVGFLTDMYMSGTTFFTLGLGDVTPVGWFARVLVVAEAGLGFGFLAISISYLPVLYGAFSRREVNISLMDTRAGSPPSAGELLRRNIENQNVEALRQYLKDLEPWSAELMESHLSYPVLCFFRSQHSNQSWLASLAAVLDACAFLSVFAEGTLLRHARRTFAISRHAIVDLAQALHTPPQPPDDDRLPAGELEKLLKLLAEAGAVAPDSTACGDRLVRLRRTYEPYINALSERLLLPLPRWTASAASLDNWQTSAWGRKQDRSTPQSLDHF
jgi:hypothetical protein